MKKFMALLAALLVTVTSVMSVYAADGKVTYDGNSQQFIFEPGSEHSPTDLFANFKSVMPGDTLTQKITVKNDASNDVKVKIYIRSLGAHENSKEFLSQLALRVKKSENNEMAYMFEAAASEKAGLSDWVCLGTLYSGGVVNLDVVLSVPTSLGNEFQDSIGYLDWEFMIEEFPVEPEDPKPPQTGDDTRLGILIAIMVASLFMMIIIFVWRKKQREQDENAK